MKRGAKIYAEYLGGAITCDAHHMTDPRSDGLGVSSCIKKSLEDAGISPEEVKLLIDLKAKVFLNIYIEIFYKVIYILIYIYIYNHFKFMICR